MNNTMQINVTDLDDFQEKIISEIEHFWTGEMMAPSDDHVFKWEKADESPDYWISDSLSEEHYYKALKYLDKDTFMCACLNFAKLMKLKLKGHLIPTRICVIKKDMCILLEYPVAQKIHRRDIHKENLLNLLRSLSNLRKNDLQHGNINWGNVMKHHDQVVWVDHHLGFSRGISDNESDIQQYKKNILHPLRK
eukprot:TRINITY_DN6548_c0_g2_i1.p1 TRINITY_DN6548_c0_g2~~TRINITY_DN6548_c0_g2_i1.p1  ORF type:complete len:208 (+),score=31.42 TRINITY_DN6548_c0_g2_i1:46-624(+)